MARVVNHPNWRRTKAPQITQVKLKSSMTAEHPEKVGLAIGVVTSLQGFECLVQLANPLAVERSTGVYEKLGGLRRRRGR